MYPLFLFLLFRHLIIVECNLCNWPCTLRLYIKYGKIKNECIERK